MKLPDDLKTALSDYQQAEAEFLGFREANASILTAYEDRRRETEECSKRVKNSVAKHFAAGRIPNFVFGFKASTVREIDVNKFIDLMTAEGLDPAPLLKYSITLSAFDAAVESGAIPRSIAKQVIGESSPRVSAPKL